MDWTPLGRFYIATDAQQAPFVDTNSGAALPGIPGVPAHQVWHSYQLPEGAIAALIRGRLSHSRSAPQASSIWTVLDFCSVEQCADHTSTFGVPAADRYASWKAMSAGGINGTRGDETRIVHTPNALLKWRWNKIGWTAADPSSHSIMLWLDGWFEAA